LLEEPVRTVRHITAFAEPMLLLRTEKLTLYKLKFDVPWRRLLV